MVSPTAPVKHVVVMGSCGDVGVYLGVSDSRVDWDGRRIAYMSLAPYIYPFPTPPSSLVLLYPAFIILSPFAL